MEDIRRNLSETRSTFATDHTDLTQSTPVIWAIDAFPSDLEMQLKTAAALQRVFPSTPIHPVYVLSEDFFMDRGYSPYLRPALKPMAFKAVLRILSETNLVHVKKPRILIEPTSSKAACARRLVRYARKLGAVGIAVGSHARRGLSRFFNGSFSEEIMNSSETPLLIAGPHADEKGERRDEQSRFLGEGPKTIVFPTDFSPACAQAYDQLLTIAMRTGAEIHLFHKQTYAVDPYVQGSMHMLGSGWVSIDALTTDIPEDNSREINAWTQAAADSGVPIRLVNENFREPTSEAIVEYVRSLNDASVLLAMVSQTGPVASALLGSITRDVIRMSTCPIYLVPRAH